MAKTEKGHGNGVYDLQTLLFQAVLKFKRPTQLHLWIIVLSVCHASIISALVLLYLLTLTSRWISGLITMKSNGRILKANLSWTTRKKSYSSDAKISLSVFVSFFFELKAELQVLKFDFCQVKRINLQLTVKISPKLDSLQLEFAFGMRL